MNSKLICFALAAGAALLVAPAPLQAQTQASLEQRVRDLEEALAALRGELAQQQAARAGAADRLITLEQRPPSPAASPTSAPDGFKAGDATIKLGGFVKAEALVSAYTAGDTATTPLGRDFYLPSSIPVGGASGEEDPDFDAHAKQTRLWVSAARTLDGHTAGIYLEGDFQSAPGTQGSERTTNAYDFALRRAYLTIDHWLFGQDWSTFMNVAVLPEGADFIGPTEGTVFVREPMVRYTRKFGAATIMAAVENSETSYITPTSAALLEPDDDSLPDGIIRIDLAGDAGNLSFAGVVRQLSVDSADRSAEDFGWGVSASGKLNLGARDDLRFSLSGGEGIGRYLGLNFAPDAILTSNGLEPVSVLAGFAAVRHLWTPKLRSTLTLSGQTVDQAQMTPVTANELAWSAAANLFYSPAKGIDLGVELRHGERKAFNGQDGALDRLHIVAKQGF